MCFADPKRHLELVLYDPAAAAASLQRAANNKRARQDDETTTAPSSSSAAAAAASEASSSGVMVPYAGTTTAAILDVAPINSAPPPPLLLRPPPVAAAAGREEPPCLRRHFLAALGLRADLPVHFIGEKCMTNTDLNPQQNRFRIPSDGVERHLRPILSPQELDAANLLFVEHEDDDPCPAPKKKRPRLQEEEEPAGPSEPPPPPQKGQLPPSGEKKMKKPKKKGKVHGGLRVKLVHLHAGAVERLMARWDSSKGTVLKGEGYVPFIRRCGFREGDNVEIWAFVQRRFRLFGKDIFGDSLLHILVVNKEEEPGRCCFCHHGGE